MPHHPLRHIQPGGRHLVGWRQQAQRFLQHIDAGAAMRRIDHQPQTAAWRQHRQQRAQPLGRVGQMVQHAAAIDVIEWSQPRARQIQQRTLLPDDVVQATRRGARLRDLQRCGGSVEPGHATRPPFACHLLRQHDGGVAGAATGDERAQRLRHRTPGAEHPIVDLAQMAWAADDKPLRLIARIAARIGNASYCSASLASVASVIGAA